MHALGPGCKYKTHALDEFFRRMHCMRMAKSKKDAIRHVQVRMPQSVYDAVDAARGPLTRQKWILWLIKRAAGVPT